MTEETKNVQSCCVSGKKMPSFIFGAVIGFVLAIVVMFMVMPSMMIVTKETTMGVDETIAALQERIVENGWTVKGVANIKEEINKAGLEFEPEIMAIKLCKAEYAKGVLTTDRNVSCLMPCTMTVWQGDDGKVYLSKMNLALMAKMFGGNVGKIMGGNVVADEEKMLEGLLK